MENVKNRIKIVLAENNLRSKFLVDNLGVTKTTVSRWINNTHQPTLNHLYKIAELLNIDVCDLLVRNELKKEAPQPTDKEDKTSVVKRDVGFSEETPKG